MIILELNWINKTPFWIHPLSIPEQNIKKSQIIEGLILPEASSHHYSLFYIALEGCWSSSRQAKWYKKFHKLIFIVSAFVRKNINCNVVEISTRQHELICWHKSNVNILGQWITFFPSNKLPKFTQCYPFGQFTVFFLLHLVMSVSWFEHTKSR